MPGTRLITVVILLLVSAFFTGCAAPARMWVDPIDQGGRSLKVSTSTQPRYPNVAFVYVPVNSFLDADSMANETVEAIRLIRAGHGSAYRLNELHVFNQQLQAVAFRPEYVAMMFVDLPRVSKQEIPVMYVWSADAFFSLEMDSEALARSKIVVTDPFEYVDHRVDQPFYLRASSIPYFE